MECARYEVALTGSPVPISLLPNGKTAHHLDREMERRRQRAAGRPGAGDPARTPRPGFDRRMPETIDRHRPAALPRRAPDAERTDPAVRAAERRPKRRWWQRITDWMRGPA